MALNEQKVAEKAAVWGDEGDYLGHAPHSTAMLKMAFPDNLAPADRYDYDPLAEEWETFPGAAARANGYPRADGRSQ